MDSLEPGLPFASWGCYTRSWSAIHIAHPVTVFGVFIMWRRPAAALVLCLSLAVLASAQVGSSTSRALPPEKSLIERLNLKSEWAINLPIDGRKDSITLAQTIDDQLFIQTRRGLLVAIDMLTGRVQWSAQLGNGDFVNNYQVAANSKFVFATHITKLYSFHRYTGAVEFVTDVGSPPSAGLAADEQSVYCVLGVRGGNSGAQRVAVYILPRPISIAQNAKIPNLDQHGKPMTDGKPNPVDSLMSAYTPSGASPINNNADIYDSPLRQKSTEVPTGGFTGSRTPSLATLPKITPPYTLDSDVATPSLDTLPSLKKPYRIRNETAKNLQQTASIGSIPPSVAAALALSDLRPKTLDPTVRWEFGTTSRILFPVSLTPLRAWIFTDSREAIALSKVDKKVDVRQVLSDPVASPPARAGLSIYIPLTSGYLVDIEGALSLLGGGAHVQWRTVVGGINNRTPFVTDAMVYTQGDNSGVVCVNRKSGEVVWRSEITDDRILAANKDFIYVFNHQGRLNVYDAKRPTDPLEKRSLPLAGIDLSQFNVPITNTSTDRLLLAADNGLIVCLRDLSPKYARPVRICPEAMVNEPTQKGVGIQPGKDNSAPKEAAEPKKEQLKQ